MYELLLHHVKVLYLVFRNLNRQEYTAANVKTLAIATYRAREGSCNCPHFAIVSPSPMTLNLPLHDLVNGGAILSLSWQQNFRFRFQPRAPAHVSFLIHARKKTRTKTRLRTIVRDLLIVSM